MFLRTSYLTVSRKWMPQGRDDKKDSAGDELPASAWTALTPSPPCEWQLGRIQLTVCGVDSKNIKQFMFHKVKERSAQRQEGVEFVQYKNEERKPVVCLQLVVWHFEKFRVLANIIRKEITKHLHWHWCKKINSWCLPFSFISFQRPARIWPKFKCPCWQQKS